MIHRVKEWFKKKMDIIRDNKKTPEVRILLVTTGAIGLTLLFFVLTLISVPRVPRVAKQFCRALEKGNLKKMERYIGEDENGELLVTGEMPEELLALYDPKTERVKCTMFKGNIFNVDSEKKEVVMLLSIYDESGLKKTRALSLILERINGKNKIVDIQGADFGFSSGILDLSISPVSSIDVEIKVLGKDLFKQSIRIQYNKKMSDNDIWWWLRNRAQKSVEQLLAEGNYTYEHRIENGVSCIYIIQKGTAEEISKNNCVSTSFYYAHDGSSFKIKNDVGLRVFCSFNGFAQNLNGVENVADYTVSFMPGTILVDGQGKNSTVKGGVWKADGMSSSEYFILVGAKWNFMAIGFWTMLLVSTVCGIILIKKYWSNFVMLIKTVRSAKEQETPQINIVIAEKELKDLDIEIDLNEKR